MRELVKPGRYAMFLRKSREDVEAERAGKFETLAKHESALRRLADDLGLAVVHVYRELVSGASLSDRDDARQMLEDVMSGAYDGVLAFDLQRLTRGDMIDQGTIMRVFALTGTLIVTPGRTYDPRDESDENFAEIEMMFGRMELSRITRRLVSGKEEAVRQGQYIGSLAPYGWRKVARGRMKTLEPSDDNARMVSWYERIAAHEATPRQIADEMNELRIPTPRGKTWDRSLVIRIIQNPVNKGYVRWNQKRTVAALGNGMQKVKRRQACEPVIAKGLHEGTVNEDLWQRANDAISGRANASVCDGRELKDPLAGILVCKGCGRSMRRVRNTRWPVEYYNHPQVNKRECWQAGAKIDDVVALLIETLVDEAEAVSYAAKAPRRTSAVPQLEKDLESEGKSVETLFRLVEKGMITDEEFAERRRLADERLTAIKEKLTAARETDRKAARTKERTVMLKEAIAQLSDYQGRAKAVNDCLKSLVDRIEYEKDPETRELRLRVFLK